MTRAIHAVYDYFFFFKQKTAYEISTRDGVQTCALPICYRPARAAARAASPRGPAGSRTRDSRRMRRSFRGPSWHHLEILLTGRSEEGFSLGLVRRVALGSEQRCHVGVERARAQDPGRSAGQWRPALAAGNSHDTRGLAIE